MPGFLACLPLALEVAKLLYKHRQKIKDTIEDLTERTSAQTKQVSDSIANDCSAFAKEGRSKVKSSVEISTVCP